MRISADRNGRGTGRTTNQLLDAIAGALRGGAVLYFTPGPTAYFSRLAMHLAQQLDLAPTFSSQQNRVTFAGRGSIYFRPGDGTPEARERHAYHFKGIPGLAVVLDHAIIAAPDLPRVDGRSVYARRSKIRGLD
ncbi:MAG: hypothetical protein NW206_19675 [Hyphomonadaceae bacterium]|nr:hypothetical protein [Hyphomonadaceae bacterium]